MAQVRAPELLEGIPKSEEDINREKRILELNDSTNAVRMPIQSAKTPEGQFKGFEPHATGFVGYMIAHETFHRICIKMASQ